MEHICRGAWFLQVLVLIKAVQTIKDCLIKRQSVMVNIVFILLEITLALVAIRYSTQRLLIQTIVALIFYDFGKFLRPMCDALEERQYVS